jgi:hypothetical protein
LSVVAVGAEDQDEGVNDDIIYAITDGNLLINGTMSFSINESTGLISVNVPMLDREEHPMYDLTIRVSATLQPAVTHQLRLN